MSNYDESESGSRFSDVRWWAEDNEAERARIVCDVAARIWKDQEASREGMLRAARMYGSLPLMGLSPKLYRQRTVSRGRRIALNVIKAVVNTYTAMVTKDKPKISFVTSGGDDALQRRAKKLEKFVDGTAYDQKLHTQAYQVVRDSALFDFGVVKFFLDTTTPKQPRVGIERTLPWEWLFDDQEAADGKPPNGYHAKFVDRRAFASAVRAGHFGKPDAPLAAQIESLATASGFDDLGESFEQANLVEWCVVIEGWHLASGEHAGRHVIAVVGVDTPVLDEEYDWHRFPCELLYRERPIQGVHGESLADELAPIQVEISRLLLMIQRAQMYAVGHWLVEENSRVNTNAIDDVVASIIRYAGTKPEYQTPNTVASDVYAHLDRLWNKAFELPGVSQMTAMGQKPAGLNSGKAIETYADVSSTRFKPNYAEYQDWYMRVAEQILHHAAKIAESHPDFTVRAPGKMMEAVKWADVHLREEEYVLSMYPTNKLADDPAARLGQVQDMMNAGMVTPEDGRRLLDMPDIESLNSYASASYDNTMEAARRIIEEGEYFGPVAQMNLQEAIKQMQMVFLKARFDNVPEDRLDMLDRWISDAQDLLPPPPPPPAPPPPVGSPGPAGPTGPTMQQRINSDLARMQAHHAASNMMGV
ncbi:hypothetical protein AKJ09_00043 [Labilithrix luteola]|uniref:Portal protein n=1 Tax=Labilithrix luteola TaxID=1391654 RepID=A0A0K1PJU2_9BACT|nr:hypothetical protein [Labilithrix luteola]AKU93379.1 hypothetical protein AKJ09_00043 [Labilithrix luteola]